MELQEFQRALVQLAGTERLLHAAGERRERRVCWHALLGLQARLEKGGVFQVDERLIRNGGVVVVECRLERGELACCQLRVVCGSAALTF